MPSFSQYLAVVAAFTCVVSGFTMGELPSQTAGCGEPFVLQPTPAPSMELVKARMEKRAVTNVCTEWTIPGGFGQPQCSNSETCLFTSASGYFYEGCGQTSIPYNWVTECWPYGAKAGVPPVSQIYCGAAAPSCGYYAFIFKAGYTYFNFGCSTVSYSLYVDLLPSTSPSSSSSVTTTTTPPPVVVGGQGTSTTTTPQPVTTTAPPSSIVVGPAVSSSATSSSAGPASTIPANVVTTSLPSDQQVSSQSSTPRPVTSTVSPVVVVVGGTTSYSTPTQSTSTVTNQSQFSPTATIGSHSDRKSTPIGAIIGGVIGGIAVLAFIAFLIWFCIRKSRKDRHQKADEHQAQADAATAAAFNSKNRISEIAGKPHIPPSVAGVYGTGEKPVVNSNTQDVHRPLPQGYDTELSSEHHPASPQSPPPVYAHPSPNMRYSSPPPASTHTELDTHGYPISPVNELGGNNRGSWQTPHGLQEMHGSQSQIAGRRPGGRQSALDMSGNPIHEDFHHELE